MLNKVINLIEYNIMIILSIFMFCTLVIGQIDLITGILIYCMWFYFGFVSFQKGYNQKVDEDMREYYRDLVEEEYNKVRDEISNN